MEHFRSPIPLSEVQKKVFVLNQSALVRIFIDASFADGKAGLGAVEVYPNGWLGRRWAKACVTSSAEEAELLAVEFGILMAREMGMPQVEILSDSQATINAIIARSSPTVWSLVGVFSHILEAERFFSKLCFLWVQRTSNENADNLCVWARNNLVPLSSL